MKKIFTLMLASLFSVALFAATTADRRPTVTLKSSRGYEIVIDGRSYFNNTYDGSMDVLNLRDGRHTIEVYKVSNFGLFRKQRKMVSASAFNVRNNDIKINVDYFGKVQIVESKDRRWNDNRGWDKQYDDREMERHDRDGRGGRF